MKQERHRLSRVASRGLFISLVFAIAAVATSDWVRGYVVDEPLKDPTTWLGAVIGGFALVFISLFGTLFALGLVLKFLDWKNRDDAA